MAAPRRVATRYFNSSGELYHYYCYYYYYYYYFTHSLTFHSLTLGSSFDKTIKLLFSQSENAVKSTLTLIEKRSAFISMLIMTS